MESVIEREIIKEMYSLSEGEMYSHLLASSTSTISTVEENLIFEWASANRIRDSS